MDSPLPLVNAILNGSAAVLLLLGYRAIRGGRREVHARFMVAAFAVSALFLGSYLYYHFVVVPRIGHTEFHATGLLHTLYLLMLFSHIVLAVANLPMILSTFWLAHRQAWERHRRLARWTFPVWLYVSVTGVLVYLCLYVFNPEAPAKGVVE